MIRHLIWDFDGTLFDTYPAIVNSMVAAVAELAAAPSHDKVRDLSLVSVGHCLTTMAATYDLPLHELETRFEQHYQQATPEDQPPFEGAAEVCELICARGGLNLIVTHRRRSGMNRLLSAHGLADLITDTVTYDDGYPHKPDPAAFLMLIARHHLRPDQTLGVGDRDIDVLAAHAAGVPAALFAPVPTPASADVVLADFGELRRMVEFQPARSGAPSTARGGKPGV